MVRERPFFNLAIGLIVSLFLHGSLVIWGPPISLLVPTIDQSAELEVDVHEWPPPQSVSPLETPPAPVESPPPPKRPAVPEIPPNIVVLRQSVQAALMPVQPEQSEVRLPEPPLSLPTPEPSSDPMQVVQGLMESLQTEVPPLQAPEINPSLPNPERRQAERRELPPLPVLDRLSPRALMPSTQTAMALPPTNPTLHIKGPAAERRVIFQPPPPTATVESESDIELRFWILPNGTVSRVMPLKKSDPRLEALATNYLRQWRFNPLPAGVEQDEQWGIIPFKFRIR